MTPVSKSKQQKLAFRDIAAIVWAGLVFLASLALMVLGVSILAGGGAYQRIILGIIVLLVGGLIVVRYTRLLMATIRVVVMKMFVIKWVL